MVSQVTDKQTMDYTEFIKEAQEHSKGKVCTM